MFANRRGFLYKRSSHDGAAAAALVPNPSVAAPSSPAADSAPSSDPKTSNPDPINPLTPADPSPKTTQSAATTPSAVTPALPAPASSSSGSSPSPSSSSSPSSAASPNSASSSATTRGTLAAASTPSSVAPLTSAYVAPTLATQVVSGVSFTPSSTLSHVPTSSATPGSSGTTNTGAIVGGIAGTLAGIAILGFLLMWCMRRQRDRDIDDFDAQAFKRQSAVLVDDPVEPSRSYNPRPPTMIERHNASPALAAQTGYSGQNFYGSYGGYGQQPPYAAPDMIQSAGSPPPQAYGAQPVGYAGYNDPQQRVVRQPSNVEHAAYDGQQQLARQPSNAAYLTRQQSSAAGYTPPSVPPASLDPNAKYIDLNRSSVSPYQAAQYADISRQLGSSNPNTQAAHESVELPDEPLPSPFDDPVDANPSAHHPAHTATPGPVTAAPAPQTLGNASEPHQRPTTVYEEGDAYGGI